MINNMASIPRAFKHSILVFVLCTLYMQHVMACSSDTLTAIGTSDLVIKNAFPST